MEEILFNFVCKVGGLRLELKSIENSLANEDMKGDLRRTLAQLDLVTLSIGKIQSVLRAQRIPLNRRAGGGGALSTDSDTPSTQRAIDYYQNLLCAEIPRLAPDWVVLRRDATSIKLYQIASCPTLDETLVELKNCVLLEFLPETNEYFVKVGLKHAAMGDESVRFEFHPEHFLESTVGVLQNALEVKHSAVDVKLESPVVVEDSGIGASPDVIRDEGVDGGGTMTEGNASTESGNLGSRKRRRQPQPQPPLPVKYENLDESDVELTEPPEADFRDGDYLVDAATGLSGSRDIAYRSSRPSRSASAFAHYSEIMEDDDDDDDDDEYVPAEELAEIVVKKKSKGDRVKRRAGRPGKKKERQASAAAALKLSDEEPDGSAERPRERTKKKDDDEDMPDCRLCGKKVSRYNARSHMSKIHEAPGFQCCFCLNEYPNAVDLRKHIHTTHGKKPSKKLLPCKDCSLLLCENECVDHNRIEHQKPLECPFCDYGSASKDPADMNVRLLLQQALTTSTPESKLKRHIYNDHFNQVYKRHRCLYCQTSFKLPEMLEEHTNRDLDPAKRTVYLCHKMRAEGEKEAKTICSHCGQSFNVTYIKTHIQRIHEKSLPFKYKCQFCPKRYEHPKRLRSHLLQFHFPEKKDIGCHLCPKKFASHRMLRQHIKTHSAPAVNCPKCEKVFRTKNNMKQHLLSHFPPQYECLVCNRKFVYRCGLKTHLQQVHKYPDWENYIRKEPREDQDAISSADLNLFADFENIDGRRESKFNQNVIPFETVDSFQSDSDNPTRFLKLA